MGVALLFLVPSGALTEVNGPSEKIRFGVADVERIIREYWRTPRMRAELDRYRTSEEYRQKQAELARLERELGDRRFSFFQRGQDRRLIQRKRDELRKIAEKETRRVREREEEAIESIMTDIRKTAEWAGRDKELTIIFDSNTPHIMYSSEQSAEVDDVTDSMITNINFR